VIVVDKNAIVLRDPAIAKQMMRPRTPNTSPDGTPPCESCGKALDEVFITTGGPQGDPNVWFDHPIAVDGWSCVGCGVFRYPRDIAPATIHELMEAGVEHGRAGRFIDAELCFLRVVWNWPGYPPGHLNYAEATRSRLHATRDELDDARRRRLVQRMIEQYEEGVAEATQASPGVARAFLTLVEHAIDIRAFDRARRFLTALAKCPGADDETQQHAAGLLAYVEQRMDLFHAAAQVVEPFIDLSGRPMRAVEPNDRKAIADALVDLEEHLRHAPDRWQSHWLYAKALFAAERTGDGFAAFARAIAKFPDSIDIARDYTTHLLKAERSAEARDVNRAIAARHPTDASMLSNLAVTELLCGDLAAATAALARARELDPDDPIAKAVEGRIARGAPFPSTLRELERGG
jgi:tetratricopeptide (TPR) repeat protein